MQKEINGQIYRIKPMNAIETLAIRQQLDFENIKVTVDTYNQLLERLEIKVGDDQWLTVKQGDVYYPSGLENDIGTVKALLEFFIVDYLKPLFTKSNASSVITQ